MSLAHSACSERNYTNLLCHLTCWLLAPQHCQSCANTGCSHTENEVYLFFSAKTGEFKPRGAKKWCSWKLPVAVLAEMELDLREEQGDSLCPQPSTGFKGQTQSSALIQTPVLFPKKGHWFLQYPTDCLHTVPLSSWRATELSWFVTSPWDCSPPWFGQVHHSSLEWRNGSAQTKHSIISLRKHIHTLDPSPQIHRWNSNPEHLGKQRCTGTKSPWKLNSSFHKATEP